ncbi:MAG: hypothetical protein R3C18_09715 [Planctomycetaceae bacterium]
MDTPNESSEFFVQLERHYQRLRGLHRMMTEHVNEIERELLELECLLPDVDEPELPDDTNPL